MHLQVYFKQIGYETPPTQRHQTSRPDITSIASHLDICARIGVAVVRTALLIALEIAHLSADFLVHETLVVLQLLLDVDLEVNDVVQNPLNLRVQLLAEGRRADRQLLVPAIH